MSFIYVFKSRDYSEKTMMTRRLLGEEIQRTVESIELVREDIHIMHELKVYI